MDLMVDDSLKLLNLIAQTIFDKNGSNIFALDVRETDSMTDYLIIAEGNVNRHVRSLSKRIIEAAGRDGVEPFLKEGDQEGDWLVIDFVDVVVHLFVPEVRERFALEELWNEGKIVDLDIIVPSKKADYE